MFCELLVNSTVVVEKYTKELSPKVVQAGGRKKTKKKGEKFFGSAVGLSFKTVLKKNTRTKLDSV